MHELERGRGKNPAELDSKSLGHDPHDLRQSPAFKMRQHRAEHLSLAIPANEIGFAQTARETGKELRG